MDQQITDLSNDTNFTNKDFKSLASRARARTTHAGGTTLKRAAIVHAFIRAQGAEWQWLLELVSQFAFQRLNNAQLSKIFYSRPNQEQIDKLD